MLLLASNIKHLRKVMQVSQQDVADYVGLANTAISGYEKEKFYPGADTLAKMCEYFRVGADDLLFKDLAGGVASNVFEPVNTERISSNVKIVAEEQAEYAGRWSKKFTRGLTYLNIPGIEGEARTFEVYGNSMNPVLISGDYVACTPCSLPEVKAGQIYAIVVANSETDANPVKITYAQVEHNRVLCIPANNAEFTSYHIQTEDISEVWEAKVRLTTKMTDPRMLAGNIEHRLKVLEEFFKEKFPNIVIE